mmetsp:Transcript_43072/g.48753  ORF Transcript_43072/g.48753 Transcript_43072/m.48753 type:complete len:821 (-) Transcript_43072:44-2506(-)
MRTRVRTTTLTSLFTPTASASRTIGLPNQQPEQQNPIGMLFSMTSLSSSSSLSSTTSDTDTSVSVSTSDTDTATATATATTSSPNNNNNKNKFQQRPDVESSKSKELTTLILEQIRSKSTRLGQDYADTFGLDTDYDKENEDNTNNNSKVIQYTSAGLYAVLDAIKTTLVIRKEKDSDDNNSNDNSSTSNTIGFGLSSHPFVLRKQELEKAMLPVSDLSDSSSSSNKSKSKSKTSKFVLFDGAYTMRDLEQAVEDDFLDASRGSTDNRKGWKIAPVSIPKGDSFEEARMTYDDILLALDKGTVIFNAFGAHVPKLAGPCLAATDATHTPNAVNLYVTKYNMRTSAPPHTDKQDVIVVQTNGKKKWRVYQPTIPALKPNADIFARGKGEDNLPLYVLEKNTNKEPPDTTNINLLLETELGPGDVLFLPAGFPHTTGTVYQEEDDGKEDEETDEDHKEDEKEGTVVDKTSVHLTFNIDTHIWELDYLNARRLVLRKANVVDYKLGQSRDVDNIYVGRVNELPTHLHRELFQELPLGFLNPDIDDSDTDSYCSVEYVTKELKRIAKAVDEDTFNAVGDNDDNNDDIWKETVLKLKEHGQELVDIHRDMYLAAMEEERTRIFEQAMSAASPSGSESAVGSTTMKKKKKKLTPEQVQRLSLFRVKKYYEKIDQVKANLLAWSYESKPSPVAAAATIEEETGGEGSTTTAETGSQDGTTIVAAKAKTGALPENWAFVMPMKVGDEVEADLGGAFFPATITRVLPGTVGLYDLTFFDGDQEKGMERNLIKLLKPPAVDNDDDQVDTSTMTPKQLKRWKKAQQKKKKK